ncbi:hypothetical protein DM01DRAFT_1100342 [Hesseltinella vesiculosa]|uniref:UBA domain-containing protein n=1 Tax=Hesseltinella vesiculosa TaxID=101127 RepID=A0A1X2GB96_9FUNG|nr:hypothetical protein DM01DRAFT_1100342 [Hesseltinella vesiculosa]
MFDHCEIPFLAEHELPEKQRMMEVHGSGDDDMPTEARVVGPQAAHNAEVPASSSASQPPAPAATTQQPSRFPEQHIQTLTNLGMSRQEAIQALEMSNGNLDLAASLLF